MSEHKISHSERSHALLSASGSSRWLTCTPSARLEDKVKDRKSSVYAEEGTLAHEMADAKLRHLLGETSAKEYKVIRAKLVESELYTETLEEGVEEYVDYCLTLYNEVLKEDPEASATVEEKFDLSEVVPGSFGSCDFNITSYTTLYVTDLKFGKGLKVEAENNSQLKLYGLGAYLKNSLISDIQTIVITIVQPRLGHISTAVLSASELMEWAEGFVKPKAALAWEGKGELVAGDHCRFCKVNSKCRAFADMNLELAKYEFQDPYLLNDEELLNIYSMLDMLTVWANSVKSHVQTEAIKNGKKWPGYKLVEGKSNRYVKNEDDLVTDLVLEGVREEDIYNKKLKGITDLTKLLGTKTFKALVEPHLEKPEGAPTLVPETDKRPELNSHAKAVEDFKDA